METICIVGLGYVGLPLALELEKHYGVIGYDVNIRRINELKEGVDSTLEVDNFRLSNSKIHFTNNPKNIKAANIVILTIPTPIDNKNNPDLSLLKKAIKTVGENLSKNSIVVIESTVYPGVVEDICVPILEDASNLIYKKDFYVGYSPERINPGDKERTIDKIVKIVAGCDEKTADKLVEIYSKIVKAGIYKTRNIKTAEAAKVIENVQRDLNIALINELSLIFNKMGLNTKEVIDAAQTKWNFHYYRPGLVGGHCIPVDPYYLTYKAKELGYTPKIILAGRDVNEYMPTHVANLVLEALKSKNKDISKCTVLIMGLTFKKNVKDTRTCKAEEVIAKLQQKGIKVLGYDPWVDDIQGRFGIKEADFNNIKVDCIIVLVHHDIFKSITLDDLKTKMDDPILVDVKWMYDKTYAESKGFFYRSL